MMIAKQTHRHLFTCLMKKMLYNRCRAAIRGYVFRCTNRHMVWQIGCPRQQTIARFPS